MAVRVSKVFTNETGNRIIQIECAGKPNAKAKTSTATGLGQFLDQTWFGVLYKHGPLELAKQIRFNSSTGLYSGPRTILDMRKAGSDPKLLKLNIDTLVHFTEDNIKVMGKGWTDGDIYLAHFSGAGVAKKLIQLPQDTPASKVYSAKAIAANKSILSGKTIGKVRAWAAKSMKERWDNAGQPDWIGMYYPQSASNDDTPVPEDDHVDNPVIKLEPALMDADNDGFDDATGLPMPGFIPKRVDGSDDADDAPDIAPSPVDTPDDSDDDVAATKKEITLPKGVTIKGDTETWWIQFRLQRMHYGPSMLDGRYGGKTSAAIAAFLNDRPDKVALKPPTSTGEFLAMRTELKEELTEAENENWTRPVTKARKEAAPEVVKEVAPEAAPIQRNVSFGIWGTIVTAVTGFLQWAGDSISSAWDFYTQNKDNIPSVAKEPSTLSWLWSKIASLPAYVWLALACVTFLFFTFNSSSGLKTIIDKIKSGER